ncbi:MAG TPA: translesion error-prone DNA polymerase V autoproteolytic subunit [Thermotogota bacterium]|nr:translesion error-prone DNA polymerase V autoproteolytic subunit [Thermotogota bacterium]HNR64262.1 translesion error-prone DNA polymerase V autoproteolytic subunit [Thermotogota bacterium]HNT95629.1 translesion error-prone DNA polymerase V autoproteolytic subunit [Thermotogota bacterium]HOZ12817.1 translesion error-prone DNA polymerase V autoproteolytic subunit [Thermotogota bacterium]HPB87640.1 translesion error-prone DNA polymerase V autoproteolytic subunit [Thermotogota bacterium]
MVKVTEVYLPDLYTSYHIPMAGSKISAGFPSPADDYMEVGLDLNEELIKNPAATYFVRVSGDSMIDAGIHDHDILIVDRSIEAREGKIVIAILDGELVVKRLQRVKDQLFLVPENKKFRPIPIHPESDFLIWGTVTNVIHSV